LAIYLLFPAPRLPDTAVFERGVVAPQDVIAEVAFDIPKAPDDLLREQMEAASGVPPVYVHDLSAADSILTGVRGLFASLDSIARQSVPQLRRAGIRSHLEANLIDPPPAAVEHVVYATSRSQLRQSFESGVRELYARGIAPSSLGAGVSTVRVEMSNGVEQLL